MRVFLILSVSFLVLSLFIAIHGSSKNDDKVLTFGIVTSAIFGTCLDIWILIHVVQILIRGPV